MNGMQRWTVTGLVLAGFCLVGASDVMGQTGVSDDRVSLPEGPGSLEGIGENVETDPNMGVMRYGVPIQVPEGFAGVTPQVRLAYSSGNGGGVLGMGWSMDFPYVERMTYRGLPEYTLDDDFSANGGTQLVALPGTEPPTYRARYEKGFERYRWHQAGEGAEGYWTVEYPDGRVGYFGARSDGTLVSDARVGYEEGTFRYMLVEMVDVYGHKAVYSYQKYGNVALVRNVGYVFTTNPESPRYSVSFSYEERMDETGFDYLSDAKGGFNELLTQRLSAINVFSGAERIRRYELTYEQYAESGGFTRLSGVRMLGLESDPYPIKHDFGYSRALGGVCGEAVCDEPFVVEMGNIGVNVGVGRATLLDINGDSLPDLVNTSADGPHTFLLNVPTVDGSSRFADTPIASAVEEATGSGFRLGTRYVQVLDVNGDGFTDMLHAQTGRVLINRGNGDWEMTQSASGTETVAGVFDADFDIDEGSLRTIRFLDYDNDKRIDVLRSTRTETSIYRNLGMNGFEEDEQIDLLGYGVQSDGIQFSDMNGDGLLDPVKLNVGGLRYKLNLGWGRWSEEVEVLGLPIGESELDVAALEDLNGDGLSDLVVVVGSTVKYAINRNGTQFSDITTLTSGDVTGAIPQRDGTVTVLFADMNGNGSLDPVWLTSSGDATYLELFPVRPNQLSRVENGIGMVSEITYSTSVQQMARDGGWEAWAHRLPHPMLVVERMDRYDLLTNVHEVTEYVYHDGFYDGFEKQFRGYARVEMRVLGDESVEEGEFEMRYDVGAEDPYYNGLMLSRTTSSGGRPLGESSYRYEDCEVAEIPDGTALPVRYICATGSTEILKEGLDESQWATMESETEYDGYGNPVRSASLGVTAIGGQGCGVCDRDASVFGAPCGEQCLGDESYTEVEYVTPGADTNGRWILGASFRDVSYGRPGSGLKTEMLTYYDGPDYEGMALGTLDQGRPMRMTVKKEEGSEVVIETTRNRYDEHGNVIGTLDPLGTPDGDTHRREYVMDDDKLRVVQTDILLEDGEGNPYRLRREVQYEPTFDSIVENTDWMRVVDGAPVSSRRSSFYTYDQFNRLTAVARPGNTSADPTERFHYELGNPTSRVVVERRSRLDGNFDMQTIKCFDGKGRIYQTRTRLEEGLYQVDGLTLFNNNGQERRLYQPYQSDSEQCDTEAPEGTLFSDFRRDATYRVVEYTLPDADEVGTGSVRRTVYEPLATLRYDAEDTDPGSDHADTPTINRLDGQGRAVAIERWLTAAGPPAVTQIHYDGLGRMTGYTDPGGNTKVQHYDLLDRVIRVEDPNTEGDNTYAYDDASNMISATDGRGVTTEIRYDGDNRVVERWNADDRDGTLITWSFDVAPDCDPTVCTNAEGQLAQITYPGIDGDRGIDHYGYDARGRGIFRARTFAGHTFVFEQELDNADRTLRSTFPDGQEVARRYDDASRLIGVDGVIDDVTYDERGMRTSITRADGTVNTASYDARMRTRERVVLNPEGDVLQGFAYTRDREDHILTITDLDEGGPAYGAAFEYDAWYRLVGADLDQPGADEVEELRYQFNALDNITSRTSSLADSAANKGEYVYDAYGPNAVTMVDGLSMTYDTGGYMTRQGAREMEWDFLGRLTRVTPDDDDSPETTHVYGPQQSRIARIEGDSVSLYPIANFVIRDGISSLYVRDSTQRLARLDDASLAPQLLSDIAPAGAPDDEINAADAWMAEAAGAGIVDPIPEADPTGRLLMSSVRRLLLETGPAQVQLHHDHLGSITMATADGAPTGQRSFLPLGQVRDSSGYVDEFGFTGQELDPATGLIHFDFRYYDPELGRWISVDPMFNTVTAQNMTVAGEVSSGYAYVANDFTNNVDPTGLCTKCSKPGSKDFGKSHGDGVKGKVKKKAAIAMNNLDPTTHVSKLHKKHLAKKPDAAVGKSLSKNSVRAAKVERAVSKHAKVAKTAAVVGSSFNAVRNTAAVVAAFPIHTVSAGASAAVSGAFAAKAAKSAFDAVRADTSTQSGVQTVAKSIPIAGTVYSAIDGAALNAHNIMMERVTAEIRSRGGQAFPPGGVTRTAGSLTGTQ